MKGENIMYNKVDSSKGTVSMEKDIAKLWTEKDIIKKSFDSKKKGSILLSMMDLQQQMESLMLVIY